MSKYQCRACGNILEIAQAASTTFCPRCGACQSLVPLQQSPDIPVVLQQISMLLHNGQWQQAENACSWVLSQDPNCAAAYAYRLMVSRRAPHPDALSGCAEPLENDPDYQSALRCGDPQLCSKLEALNAHILEQRKHAAMAAELRLAASKRKKRNIIIGSVAGGVAVVAAVFLYFLFAVILPNGDYDDAVTLLESGKYDEAIVAFEELDGYKDSQDMILRCRYEKACSLLESGACEEAMSMFQALGEYSDSQTQILLCRYTMARKLMEDGQYIQAKSQFAELGDFSDSRQMVRDCETALKNESYQEAIRLMDTGKYEEAIQKLSDLGNFNDARDLLVDAKYHYICENLDNDNKTTFRYLKELKGMDYADCATLYDELYAWQVAIVVNDSEFDTDTQMSTVSKSQNWYFHVTLFGGEPDEQIRLQYKGSFPNGDVVQAYWDGTWGDGYTGTCWFYYNNPAYGKRGTFVLEVLDSAGNVLGTQSVTLGY